MGHLYIDGRRFTDRTGKINCNVRVLIDDQLIGTRLLRDTNYLNFLEGAHDILREHLDTPTHVVLLTYLRVTRNETTVHVVDVENPEDLLM